MSLCFFSSSLLFFFIGATIGRISDNIFCFTCIVVYSSTTCTIHAQFSPFRQNNNERKQKHLQHTQQFNHFTLHCLVHFFLFAPLCFAYSPFAIHIRSNTCNTFIFNFHSCLLSIFSEFCFYFSS